MSLCLTKKKKRPGTLGGPALNPLTSQFKQHKKDLELKKKIQKKQKAGWIVMNKNHSHNSAKTTFEAIPDEDELEDSDGEEMSLDCRMRMRNVGASTKTSAGPNSYLKDSRGFTNGKALQQYQNQALENYFYEKDKAAITQAANAQNQQRQKDLQAGKIDRKTGQIGGVGTAAASSSITSPTPNYVPPRHRKEHNSDSTSSRTSTNSRHGYVAPSSNSGLKNLVNQFEVTSRKRTRTRFDSTSSQGSAKSSNHSRNGATSPYLASLNPNHKDCGSEISKSSRAPTLAEMASVTDYSHSAKRHLAHSPYASTSSVSADSVYHSYRSASPLDFMNQSSQAEDDEEEIDIFQNPYERERKRRLGI